MPENTLFKEARPVTVEQAAQPHRCYICRKRSAVGTEDCPHWCQDCADKQARLWRQMWGRGAR